MKRKSGEFLLFGVSFGIALGVLFAIAFDDFALGIGLGLTFGASIGAVGESSSKKSGCNGTSGDDSKI